MTDKGLKRGDVVVTLTKKERELFRKNIVCKTAMEKLIAEIVSHWEAQEIEAQEIWRAVEEKYKLDADKYEYRYSKGKITYVGLVKHHELNKLAERFEIRKVISQSVKDAFKEIKE